jgi:hypothetical protein
LAAALVFMTDAAKGGIYLYEFDTVFSGQSTAPASPGPWTDVTIRDVTPGTVSLTVSNVGLSSGEFLSELYLNLNPSDNVANLKFNLVSAHGSFTNPTVSLGEDNFKAGGDGNYDILLSFSTAHFSTFTVGDSITYQVTGISNLVASDFGFLSSPDGGFGPFYAAVHVQGTLPNNLGSCWGEPGLGPELLNVPDPASRLLLAVAAGLWFTARRLRCRVGAR